MEPETKQDFYKEIDSQDLGKAGKIAPVLAFRSVQNAYIHTYIHTFFLFFSFFKLKIQHARG